MSNITPFTTKQKAFLQKCYNDKQFLSSLSNERKRHIEDYVKPYITGYGPTGKKLLMEIRQAYINYINSNPKCTY